MALLDKSKLPAYGKSRWAMRGQLPKAVKKGTAIQNVRSVKTPVGQAKALGKVRPVNGTTKRKGQANAPLPSTTKKKFGYQDYFDQTGNPYGGFRGITVRGKK